MAPAKPRKTDGELRRLRTALKKNEALMQEAAINYEKLVATKEDVLAAITARKDSQPQKAAVT